MKAGRPDHQSPFALRRADRKSPRMRTLTVDWADLEIAFRDATGAESFLDKETGEVVTLMKGFEDEPELRQKVNRSPGRFLLLPVVDASFSKDVLHAFIARMQKSPHKDKLAEAEHGAGGFARSMQMLRDDKALFASYSRFEQAALMKRVETFLGEHDIAPADAAPDVDLFEGLSST